MFDVMGQGAGMAKQRDAEADVGALERELDELVYALYGLTLEEIKSWEAQPNEPHLP